MVLKKPYAFFIKHFKLFHIILSCLVVYSIVRATGVMNFISQYLSNATAIDNLITMEEVNSVYSGMDYFVSILTFIMSLILLVVMTLKQKKNKFYAYSTTMSIIFLILNIYGKSTLVKLTSTWLNEVSLDVLSNLYLFAIMALIAQAAIAISRAAGFNISRFDFNNDILKLNAEESDSEEIEFVVDFDVNDLKRNIQKNSRYFKYFLKENAKTFIWCIGVFGAIATLYFGFSFIKNKKNTISLSNLKTISINGFKIEYNDSYIINTDSIGNLLDENKTLLVLDLTISNSTDKAQKFSLSSVNINIGETNYTATLKYQDTIKDFGKLYQEENISARRKGKDNNFIYPSSRGIYVFEIPKNQLGNKIYLNLLPTNTTQSYYIQLSPKNLVVNEVKEIDAGFDKEIIFDNNTFNGSKLVINNVEIAQQFKLNYTFKNLSYVEYIPSSIISTNQDMAVMKIVGSFETSNNSISDLYKFMSNYGYIEYKIGDETYKQKSGFNQLKAKHVNDNNTIYITVLDEIRKADSATLVFSIRGTEYRYNLNSILDRNGGN